MEALHIGQAFTSACFWRYQGITVRLKLLLWFYIKIRLKFETTCQDLQAGESTVKCHSQGNKRMTQIGFEPRSSRLQLQRSKPLNYTAELNLQGFSGPAMMYRLEKIVHPKRQKDELKVAKIKIYTFFCNILYHKGPSLFSLLIWFGILTCHTCSITT